MCGCLYMCEYNACQVHICLLEFHMTSVFACVASRTRDLRERREAGGMINDEDATVSYLSRPSTPSCLPQLFFF